MKGILPWDNSELEGLLQGVIAHGTEAAKVDFKAEVETSTSEQKAELLKDISAFANTYDGSYEDFGLLIYGVQRKEITGITRTESDTDKLQNTIDQLLRTYISPMPQTRVVGFETSTGQKWGVIAIVPSNNKPHMFFKEIQCQNPKYARKRGEWFVRRGTTTDPGLPEDLTIITQRQSELLLEPLRESIRNLQSRVANTERQYRSSLFKLVTRAVQALPEVLDGKSKRDEDIGNDIGEALDMNLPDRLKQKLRTPKDALAEDLVIEAKAIQNFLDGPETELPWAPMLGNAEVNKKIIEMLEEKTLAFQLSVATILLNDHNGIYINALLRAIKILAKTAEIPSGVGYNQIGKALRYYPLGLVIYTIFICSVATCRGDILQQVLNIPLKRQGSKFTTSIIEIFFYWHEAKALFNDAFAQRWCEPMAQRIRQIIDDRIGEMIIDFTDSEYFFRGEFVLALTHIDTDITNAENVERRLPLPGLYLYLSEAYDPIAELLIECPDWFDKLYANSLHDILIAFDQNAHKMASPGCVTTLSFKAAELYQKK